MTVWAWFNIDVVPHIDIAFPFNHTSVVLNEQIVTAVNGIYCLIPVIFIVNDSPVDTFCSGFTERMQETNYALGCD
jgi:hypothetical protein